MLFSKVPERCEAQPQPPSKARLDKLNKEQSLLPRAGATRSSPHDPHPNPSIYVATPSGFAHRGILCPLPHDLNRQHQAPLWQESIICMWW